MKVFAAISCLLFCGLFSNAYSLSASEVVDKVGKSVVYVMTYDDKNNVKTSKRMYGSGVAVQKNVIATNCHVARSGKFILVIKNRVSSMADIIGSNDDNDICLLHVHDMSFQPVTLRLIDQLKVGEDVYSIGNPGAIDNYLSRGIISQLLRNKGKDKIFSDVTTAQGSSGGGLFDVNGNLIGITTAVSNKNKNISVSMPVDWIVTNLNIRHVYSPKKSKESAIEKKAFETGKQPGMRLIGVYGSDSIALYKLKDKCFIYIPGRTTSGLRTSSALWYPADRKSIYFFAFAKNMLAAVHVIKAQKQALSEKNKKMVKTSHQVVFENKTYPVYKIGDERLSDPILYTRFEKNPTLRLAEGEELSLKLCDDSHCSTRIYGLYGFDEAVLAYNSECVMH